MKNKILILGSNPETAPLVKKAKQKGLITFIIGKEKKSIAKNIADYPILGDASNLNFVNMIIKKNKINSVMVGTVDVLINTYEKVCKKNNLPCFANEKAVKAFSSKRSFSNICKKFGFKNIPDYTNLVKKGLNLSNDLFPVLVKPIDSGGGVGARVCNSNKEVKIAVMKAKRISKKQMFICQKYFLGDDIQLYFTILNYQTYLSCVVDRTTNKNQKNKSPVCIGGNYNSKYIKLIQQKYFQQFKKIIDSLKIKNGVLSVQCFVKGNNIYPYDPGFRLQGEGQHLVLNKINKIDHLDMLLNLSMGRPFFIGNFKKINDPYLKKRFVTSVWVLLKKGKIVKILNLDKVKKMKCFLDILQRFDIGDEVRSSYIGTEKQVFCRIYLASKKKAELVELVDFIHKNLKILDSYNKSLILDKYFYS